MVLFLLNSSDLCKQLLIDMNLLVPHNNKLSYKSLVIIQKFFNWVSSLVICVFSTYIGKLKFSLFTTLEKPFWIPSNKNLTTLVCVRAVLLELTYTYYLKSILSQ
jgi:hypothetical protein